MTHSLLRPAVTLAGVVLGLGAVTWALLPGPSTPAGESPGYTAASPEETLAALPPPAGTSAVDRTVARWTEVVRRNPKDADAWAELGDALVQKGRETADAGYHGHAERAFGQALALDPRNVSATTGMAWVHGCRHEFEKSVEWARTALELHPENHLAHGLLGDAALELGDYDDAFEHYQKMVAIRPDLSSYSRGAHLLFLTGDVKRATWLMGKAIEAGAPYAENTAWCRAQLALMHFHTGNLLAAEQVLADVPGKSADGYHVLAARGRVRTARGDHAGAIECYRKASAIAPQHEVLAALGDLYRLTGQADEAEKQYAQVEAVHRLNKANGIRGDIPMARFYADHDRNLAEALRLAEEEYRTRKNVFVADTLAWCYCKNARYEDAKRAIRKALSRQTPDAGILFHAGMIHARLGDRPAAQRYLYQALSLNPNFCPVYAPVASSLLRELGERPPDAAKE